MEERLQKIIAGSGLCSRRAAEQLILDGAVRVNGHVIRTLGTKHNPETDTIVVNNKPLPKPQKVVYAVNKPKGTVCSKVKQGSAPLVTEIVPPYPPVFPVGRLDKDSEGLIILTNDGALANILTHPSYGHEKEYLVHCTSQVEGVTLDPAEIEKKLQSGVYLKDGFVAVRRPSVRLLSDGKIKLRLTITVGRHYIVRRICNQLGLRVHRLQRVRINKYLLDTLAIGSYKSIGKEDIRLLSTH